MIDQPNPFDPAAIADETAEFNIWLEEELSQVPPVNAVPPELTRKARAEGLGVFPLGGPLAGSDWVAIPGAPGGPGRVRLSLPPGDRSAGAPQGTYLHIHGGGWTIGAPEQSDHHNQRIAAHAGCRVVSVHYRLAPENPWPACADDCEAAALWAIKTFGGPIVIGGESAGGHLTAVTALRLKARGLLDAIAGLVLNYGVFDLRMTPSMANWGERYFILSTPVTKWFIGNALQGGEDPADPAISPLMTDLAGLPPALLQVGTCDPLLDDSLFMAQRWRAAGGQAELAIYPGGCHAFDMFDLEIAKTSRARQHGFVRACLAPRAAAPGGTGGV